MTESAIHKFIVRYGLMKNLSAMTSRGHFEYQRGNEVIVRTDRGLEVGLVLCGVTNDQHDMLDAAPSGQIVRGVTEDDINEINHIDA